MFKYISLWNDENSKGLHLKFVNSGSNKAFSTTVWAWLMQMEFCTFVEKIMGQIQLNTSNDINIIAIIWVLQPKWINPKLQTFYARYNRCLGCLKTGYSLLLLASSTMWCAGWSPILPGLFTNHQSPFSVASEEQILHIHPFFDVGL